MIKLELIYFNKNGKFKYDAVLELPEEFELFEIPEHIRQLRKERKLSGLESGHWDGYIFANNEAHAYPFLVLPDEVEEHARKVSEAFSEMAGTCPYRKWHSNALGSSYDCEHPKIEMDHMNCAACNCPLLTE